MKKYRLISAAAISLLLFNLLTAPLTAMAVVPGTAGISERPEKAYPQVQVRLNLITEGRTASARSMIKTNPAKAASLREPVAVQTTAVATILMMKKTPRFRKMNFCPPRLHHSFSPPKTMKRNIPFADMTFTMRSAPLNWNLGMSLTNIIGRRRRSTYIWTDRTGT